jgi:hypothetical protein
MTDFDDKLRYSLNADDEAFLKSLEDEQGLFKQLAGTFHGPFKGWVILIMIVSVCLGIAMFFMLFKLLNAPTLDLRVLWGTGLICALSMQGFIKQWLFERMNMLNVMREVKRVELRVVQLSEKIDRL